MKKYIVPEVEFVSFSNQQILTTPSCSPYNCPTMYGDSCANKTYCDNYTDPDCTDDV